MVDWLSKHWFLVAAGFTTVSAIGAGGQKILTIEDAVKANAENGKKIEEIKATQARLDERTQMILDAIKDLKDR